MRRTHAATGLAIGFGLILSHPQPIPIEIALVAAAEAASVLPDIDLRLHIPHRTITHSLLIWMLISFGAWYASPLFGMAVALGYGERCQNGEVMKRLQRATSYKCF